MSNYVNGKEFVERFHCRTTDEVIHGIKTLAKEGNYECVFAVTIGDETLLLNPEQMLKLLDDCSIGLEVDEE